MKDIYIKILELFPMVIDMQYIKTISLAFNGLITVVIDGDYFYSGEQIERLFTNSNMKVDSFSFEKRTNTYFAKIKY